MRHVPEADRLRAVEAGARAHRGPAREHNAERHAVPPSAAGSAVGIARVQIELEWLIADIAVQPAPTVDEVPDDIAHAAILAVPCAEADPAVRTGDEIGGEE